MIMAVRPYQYLSDKYLELSDPIQYNENPTYTKSEDVVAKLHGHCSDSWDAKKNFISEQKKQNNWATPLKNNDIANRRCMATLDKYMDAEKTTLRIETKVHRMAMFYRVLTTLLIGSCVMGMYTLAGNYENIYMPLSPKITKVAL